MIEKLRRAGHKYEGFYRGTVVDVTDPDKLGRVRIKISPMLSSSSIETAALPWAVPAYPLFGGSGSGFGFFAVPRLNTQVWCFFENGDYLQPVYFAEAATKVHGLPSERTTAYPKVVVWKTEDGHIFYADDKEIKITHKSGHIIDFTEDIVRIYHKSGALILIDPSGAVRITAIQDMTLATAQKIMINAAKEIYLDSAVAVKVNSGLLIDNADDLPSWTQNIVGTGSVASVVKLGMPAYGMLTGASLGSIAGILKNLPTLPTQFTAIMNILPESLGSLAAGDFLSMEFIQNGVKSILGIDATGLFVKDGLVWNQFFTGDMLSGGFKNLQLSINQFIPGASEFSKVVMDGVELATSLPAVSSLGAFTKGISTKVQSTLTSGLSANLGGLSIFEGLLS